MRFHVLTLFPEMVMQGLHTSIIGRAVENNCIKIEAVNIRDFSTDKHGKVDDYPYGGGAGMLMQAQPVYDAWHAIVHENAEKSKMPRTIYVTPQGTTFTQEYAFALAKEEELIFLCGHYEGIDARVLDEIVTDYVSIGDYVLTGGELPAMVMIDAISRLVPGVLHNDESAETESFHMDLLEYPQYSRPEVWHGKEVPKVLLSGDHGKIAQWRLEQSKLLTMERRPDLYEQYRRREKLIKRLSANKRQNFHMMECLASGRGTILADGEGILIYDKNVRTCMVNAESKTVAENLLPLIPPETKWVLSSQEFWNDILTEQGFKVACECLQACYTQRTPLPIRQKEIRPLTAEALPYLREHCKDLDADYLLGRVEANAVYGIFVGNQLAGFVGWHATGAIGMLYVDKSHRGQGLGSSLEAFAINRQLATGHMPYCHIPADNEAALKLQEKLGLYLSQEPLWYLENQPQK
ncbi:MAG: tRNA (guanosine(37)-N1)-methyltransferase TrmD [Acetatifactor sp.]|nr:tRNA (guanosine(37)-N1)-methyltransferase TrmD [Acetatifactor sp.]